MDTQQNDKDIEFSIPRVQTPSEDMDRASLRAIENRADQRALSGDSVTPEMERRQLEADVADLTRIEDAGWRKQAALVVSENAKASPSYEAALQTQFPETAKVIFQAESDNNREILEKEDRKAADLEAIDAATLARIEATRLRDSAQAREAIGLNTLEPSIEKQQQQLSEAQNAQRAAWLVKGQQTEAPDPHTNNERGGNHLESDEIFTATQGGVKPVVPPEIEKQYLRVGDKFYHPKNTELVAFEDKGNKLETKSNSEAIAGSMVRIAEARGWDEIKVSGSETFRKEVWLEAAARGMHVKGYNPSEQDKAELAKRSTEVNKVEKEATQFRGRETNNANTSKAQPEQGGHELHNKRLAEVFRQASPGDAVKMHPELAGAAAAVSAMEKKAEADGLDAQQRAIVMARVRDNVVNSIERGQIPEVKLKEEIEVKREVSAEKEHSR